MSDITALLARLDRVRGSSNRWTARCPAHDDDNPSLSIRLIDDGRVLIHCHAGCGAAAVLDAVGLDYDALYPDRFPVEHHAERDWSPKTPAEEAVWLAKFQPNPKADPPSYEGIETWADWGIHDIEGLKLLRKGDEPLAVTRARLLLDLADAMEGDGHTFTPEERETIKTAVNRMKGYKP